MADDPPRVYHFVVIEDNAADIQLLEWALDAANLRYQLTVIEDGGTAMAFARGSGHVADGNPPDLAILDLNLPKNDGIEVLEALRANPALQQLPVAVLSSSSSPRERARLEQLGVSRYLTKPPDLQEYMNLGITIRQLLDEDSRRKSTSPHSDK